MACYICNVKTPLFNGCAIPGTGEVCKDCYAKYESALAALEYGDQNRFAQLRDELIRSTPNAAIRSSLTAFFDSKEKIILVGRGKKNRRLRNEKERDFIASFPVITTDKFDGYKIYPKKVLLSATESVEIVSADLSNDFSDYIENVKRSIVSQFREDAYDNDCNAVAGLQFQVFHVETSNYFRLLITATATAMQIVEKPPRDANVPS